MTRWCRFRPSTILSRSAARLIYPARRALDLTRPVSLRAQNNPGPATYTVSSDEAGAASSDGTFDFKPHWMPTTVSVSVSDDSGTITVSNEWGNSAVASYSC